MSLGSNFLARDGERVAPVNAAVERNDRSKDGKDDTYMRGSAIFCRTNGRVRFGV